MTIEDRARSPSCLDVLRNAATCRQTTGYVLVHEVSAPRPGCPLGAYGSFALADGLDLALQANGGLVNAETARAIGFAGVEAHGDYQSRVLQLDARLRHTMKVNDALTLMPSVRLDFLGVDADGYRL